MCRFSLGRVLGSHELAYVIGYGTGVPNCLELFLGNGCYIAILLKQFVDSHGEIKNFPLYENG